MTDIIDSLAPASPADPFDNIDGEPEAYLRKPKVVPVTASVVARAQKALDGVRRSDGSLSHVLSHTFPVGQDGLRDLFVQQLRHSGDHTDPVSVVTVKVNPEGDNPNKVSWRASKPRARKAKPVDGTPKAG